MSRGPKNFEEAIDSLKDDTRPEADAARDQLGNLEQEFRKIWSSLQGLSTGDVGKTAEDAKAAAETKFQQNPWVTLGLVGLIAFVLGYLSSSRRSE